jgi:hypothetical protein
MDREPYSAAHITVLSFDEAVRKRTGMYFAVAPDSPDLPSNILRGVILEALHGVGGGHCSVVAEVTADLCFTVADNQPPSLSDPGEPEPGFYDSLINKHRWALAAAAALSARTLIEIRAAGRGWRQGLTGTAPGLPELFGAPGEADGTRATFELDAGFLAPGAAISLSPERLRDWEARCTECAGPRRADVLTISDRRSPQLSAPEQ